MKYLKYIKIILLVMTSLEIYHFEGMRYQYHNFYNPLLFRTLADLILMIILVYIAILTYQQTLGTFYHKILSLTCIILLLPDIYVWMNAIARFKCHICFYHLIFLAPIILIMLHIILQNKKVNIKYFLLSSLILIGLGFAFKFFVIAPQEKDIINYPFEKETIDYQIYTFLYCLGIMNLFIVFVLFIERYFLSKK